MKFHQDLCNTFLLEETQHSKDIYKIVGLLIRLGSFMSEQGKQQLSDKLRNLYLQCTIQEMTIAKTLTNLCLEFQCVQVPFFF